MVPYISIIVYQQKIGEIWACPVVSQGTAPSTMSNLVTLTELNMSYNFGLVGLLPLEVGNMTNLTVLHIYSTGIHGERKL